MLLTRVLLCCCPFGLGDSDRSVFGEDGTEEKGRETRTGRGMRRGGRGKRRRIGGGGGEEEEDRGRRIGGGGGRRRRGRRGRSATPGMGAQQQKHFSQRDQSVHGGLSWEAGLPFGNWKSVGQRVLEQGPADR